MTALAIRREPAARYTRTAMVFHWLIAALIFLNIAIGLIAANSDGPNVRRLVDTHKSVGLTVLGLVILRILWRFAHRPPPLPDSYAKPERLSAHAVHYLLYALILLLPLSGYIHDSAWNGGATHPIILYGLVHFPRLPVIKTFDPALKDKLHTIFGAVHVYIGYVLYGLLALHIAGALKHQLFDGEPELQRMLPGRRRASPPGE